MKSALVWQCHQALTELAQEHKVTLCWVRGHTGIEGNEKADQLAKEAANTLLCGPEPAIPLSSSVIRRDLKSRLQSRALLVWEETPGCRQSKENISFLSLQDRTSLVACSRSELRQLTGLYTGHCTLQVHMRNIGVVRSARCPKCEGEDETTAHFIGKCQAYGSQRVQLLNAISAGDDWARLPLRRVKSFVVSTGRLVEVIRDNPP